MSIVAAIALLTALVPQNAESTDLTAVLQAERERIETMQRVERAVCSVMKRGTPGGGSGVIFDPHGFVVTNYHVVGGLDVERLVVGLPDGNLYEASVLGVDPGSDLAVLLLDSRDGDAPWPYVEFGDSDELLVGQTVFAMGNPFLLATDFRPTVTFGVVSGTHRYQPGQGNRALVYPDCIQVDVPINPGNSGGPLFDGDGRVVGINGRITVRDRGRINVGVGFAIASNQIRNFLGDLMAGKHAEHGTLDLNAWFMRAPGQTGRHAVYVQALFEDSKVGDLGVQLGDEIVSFNGTPVRSANQLATLVGVLPMGTWVTLSFRPKLEAAGSYGPEREIEFTLPRLDTGSSTSDRLASDEHRSLAARAIAALIHDEPATTDGIELTLRGPDDRVVRILCRGEALRIEDGERVLVADGAGSGFALDAAGVAHDLDAEQAAKLERIRTCNPWLRRGEGLRRLVQDGLLAGGTMIGTRPAFCIELPGDGERQVYLFHDGTAAGCRYRDPTQRAVIELRGLAPSTRLVKDGELKPGWSIEAPIARDLPATLFERPR